MTKLFSAVLNNLRAPFLNFPKGTFASNASGNVALIFGLAAGTLAIGVAGAVDFTTMYSARSKLQAAADHSATAAARELYLANSTDANLSSVAKTVAAANLANVSSLPAYSVTATVNRDRTAVTTKITAKPQVQFGSFWNASDPIINVEATAQISGSGRICAIALESSADGAIKLKTNSRITAHKCAVMSNSTSRAGIESEERSQVVSELTCSAGGVRGSRSNFTPEPELDCPPIPDPLSGRAPPPVGGCLRTGLKLKAGSHILSPGVYCKGIAIAGTAQVKLKPGVYVIKDGSLAVGQTAKLKGENVGIYFLGKSGFKFEKDTVIDLTAPKDGPMAGLLMYGDRDSSKSSYVINSNDARNLLGTIYLPSGVLTIQAKNPIADRSAYTVVIVKALKMFDGPELFLNANYGASDIPLPPGVGISGNNILLRK